jgi:hypothetical protein
MAPMSLAFWVSDVCLVGVQSAVVALPARTSLPWLQQLARRLSSRWWALVPLASIVGVVFAIRAAGETADGLAWLALVAIPPLAAATLGWTMRGARPALAPLAVVLFALAWIDRTGLVGEGAAVVLSALSCVTLGVLLVAVAPRSWLKVGIVLMASVDAALVTAQLLQPANDVLNAAAPPVGLPQLQRAVFGDALIGYGDLFIAGAFGALVAAEGGRRGATALLVFALALAFDLLFLVLDVLPATVPVALALLVRELACRRGARARAPEPEQVRNSRAATVSKR